MHTCVIITNESELDLLCKYIEDNGLDKGSLNFYSNQKRGFYIYLANTGEIYVVFKDKFYSTYVFREMGDRKATMNRWVYCYKNIVIFQNFFDFINSNRA